MKKPNNIGSIIRDMRKAQGMSQSVLAGKIGVSYQQVQKYEKGASKLSVPRLIQIADVFGVPVIAFLDEKHTAIHTVPEDEAALVKMFRRIEKKTLRLAVLDIVRSVNALERTAQ